MALADDKHDSNITLEHLMSKMSLFRSQRKKNFILKRVNQSILPLIFLQYGN